MKESQVEKFDQLLREKSRAVPFKKIRCLLHGHKIVPATAILLHELIGIPATEFVGVEGWFCENCRYLSSEFRVKVEDEDETQKEYTEANMQAT